MAAWTPYSLMMKDWAFIVAIFTLTGSVGSPQVRAGDIRGDEHQLEAAQSSGAASLYERSLAAYAEASEEYRRGTVIRVLETTTISCSQPMETVPISGGSLTIECMKNSSIKRKFRETGSGIPVVEINPIRNVRDELIVDCAEYRADVRRGKVILGVFGGYRIHWRFDCSKNQFVQVRTEHYPPFVI